MLYLMIKEKSLFHIVQKIAVIALPISAGRLLHILATFIAMMMVAQLGKEYLAAGFLATSSTITILTLTSTIFYSVGIRIRYYRGQNAALSDIGLLVKNGFLIALVLAIPASLIISNLDKVLLLVHQDPQLVFLTRKYFLFAGIGMFPLLAMTVIGQFYVGIGKPRFALIIDLISFPLIILVSYALVLGHFGLPKLGLCGISLATLIVQSIILFATLVVIYCSHNNRPYELFKKSCVVNWEVCRGIFALGLPIGIQFGGELAAMAAAGYLMGYFGVDVLAAMQITGQYSIIVIMLSFGLAQALSLTVSEVYGQTKNGEQIIIKYMQAATLLLIFYVVPVSLLFSTLSTQLAEFYMGTTDLQTDFKYLIHVFFVLAGLFLFVDGVRHILSATLRGLHDSQTATRINLVSMWLIALPVSWLTAFVFKGGPVALRLGFLTGFIAAVLFLFMHLYKRLMHRTSFKVVASI